MLVRMIRNTSGPDGIACLVGEVVDLPDGLARAWIHAGRAVDTGGAPVLEAPVAPVHADPSVTATRPARATKRR